MMAGIGVNDVDFGDHGVIYITSEKDRPHHISEWTTPATQELLKILPKQLENLHNGKLHSKKSLFENCSIHLEKRGYFYTGPQCENKWKSLKRRYMSQHHRKLTGKHGRLFKFKKEIFDDEIEDCLSLEKPSLKKQLHEMSKVNLNIPPGFAPKTKKEIESEQEEEMEEDEDDNFGEAYIEDHGYTQPDEKLVEMILKEDNSGDEGSIKEDKVFAQNVDYLSLNHDNEVDEEIPDEDRYISQFQKNHKLFDLRLLKEVKELRKAIKRNCDTNTELMKTHNATHEQLLVCLDTLDKRDEEKLEIKKKKLEKQSELVQQMKIQNSLLAKLIQKLGNNSGSGSSSR